MKLVLGAVATLSFLLFTASCGEVSNTPGSLNSRQLSDALLSLSDLPEGWRPNYTEPRRCIGSGSFQASLGFQPIGCRRVSFKKEGREVQQYLYLHPSGRGHEAFDALAAATGDRVDFEAVQDLPDIGDEAQAWDGYYSRTILSRRGDVLSVLYVDQRDIGFDTVNALEAIGDRVLRQVKGGAFLGGFLPFLRKPLDGEAAGVARAADEKLSRTLLTSRDVAIAP